MASEALQRRIQIGNGGGVNIYQGTVKASGVTTSFVFQGLCACGILMSSIPHFSRSLTRYRVRLSSLIHPFSLILSTVSPALLNLVLQAATRANLYLLRRCHLGEWGDLCLVARGTSPFRYQYQTASDRKLSSIHCCASVAFCLSNSIMNV